jgi:ribose transport system substrate-binding protein
MRSIYEIDGDFKMKVKAFGLLMVVLMLLGATVVVTAQDDACPNGEGYGEGGKCRVVLVNSFLGNDYRIQMQRAATAAATHEPYSDIIDFEVLNTENTPEAQRAGLENLLLEGVDAILLDAVDNTSVNDVVERACEEGVVVVTFDITARPGACEYAVEFAFHEWATDAGRWLAAATNAADAPINVIMDRGLQGVDIADRIYQGGLDGMIEVAGSEGNINIVDEYYGEFAEGVQEPLISAILAANPDTNIDVVFTQGYCTTVVSAFRNAGLDYLPAMYCQAYNANGLVCVENDAVCFINANTNAGSIGSLDIAYRLLSGEEVEEKEIQWPVAYVVTRDVDVELSEADPSLAEVGVNVFPDLPPGFQPTFNWEGALVQISLAEASGIEGMGEATPEATAES